MTAVDRPTYAKADDDSIVVSMVGELDMAREGELVTVLDALDPLPETVIDVDLSDVTFVDSSGLRGLMIAQAYLSGRRCKLRVRRPNSQLVRLVELVGVADMLTFVDTSDGPAATAHSQTDGEASPDG